MSRHGLLTLLFATAAIPSAAAAQGYHFTPQLSRGDHLVVSNINGDVSVDRATGGATDVTVDKTVKRGNGDLVTVVMERDNNTVRICAVQLEHAGDKGSCEGEHHHDGNDHNEVKTTFHVHLAPGVTLSASTVNGDVSATGVDAAEVVATVNGNVTYQGAPPSELSTVNGGVTATMSKGTWNGTLKVESVNGPISLTFPADLAAMVSGSSVNGGVSSDFPVTIQGRWGPRTFTGRIGGGGAELHIETVNGSIELHKKQP